MYMDIKNIFSYQPELPALENSPLEQVEQSKKSEWLEMHAGLYGIGSEEGGFAYDNEKPRHSVYLRRFKIRSNLVTNEEYAEFIADSGYTRPELWLSDGWSWIQSASIRSPLYWTSSGSLFTMQGERPLNPRAPVSHLSYFEADAFARWKKCRLPTEAEWEMAFSSQGKSPLWQWTQSAYLPYPGYEPYPGALMEYNGKFMSGQMVLRGGCLAMPDSHYRPSYRNFFYPQMRWMFSGIRLCAR
jgi:formylglycine-generating enzyme required for sulfatase activity